MMDLILKDLKSVSSHLRAVCSGGFGGGGRRGAGRLRKGEYSLHLKKKKKKRKGLEITGQLTSVPEKQHQRDHGLSNWEIIHKQLRRK